MCCPAFGACIPDSVITAEWRSLLRKAFFAWQHHFTLLIKPNTRGKLKSVSSKGYVQAVDAAINASPFASQARVDLLKQVGIIYDVDEVPHLAPAVRMLAQYWDNLP